MFFSLGIQASATIFRITTGPFGPIILTIIHNLMHLVNKFVILWGQVVVSHSV